LIALDYVSHVVGGPERPRLPGRRLLDEDDGFVDETAEGIDVHYALDLVRDATVNTKASHSVQEALCHRTRGYCSSPSL
jgi:hypothetical protein